MREPPGEQIQNFNPSLIAAPLSSQWSLLQHTHNRQSLNFPKWHILAYLIQVCQFVVKFSFLLSPVLGELRIYAKSGLIIQSYKGYLGRGLYHWILQVSTSRIVWICWVFTRPKSEKWPLWNREEQESWQLCIPWRFIKLVKDTRVWMGGKGGPHVGCRLKFHYFVGCRLKLLTFVGCR